MMKIQNYHVAHISSAHYENDLRIFAKEAVSLAKSGFRVTYIVQAKEKIKKKRVTICNLSQGTTRWHRLWRLYEITRKIKSVKPDLVHLHDPELLALIFYIKLKYKLPVIFDDHENLVKDIPDKISFPFLSSAALSAFTKILLKIILRWTDGLVLVAEAHKDDYQYYPQEKIAIVRNFPIFDSRLYTRDKSCSNRIIFLGRSSPVIGTEEMIRSILYIKHKDVSLEIIGPIDAKYQKKMERFIDSLGLKDRVFIVSTTDQEKIKISLLRSEIGFALLRPASKYENIYPPTKTFTYMMYKIPVVISNIPKWVELIETLNCGLAVNFYSPQEIADSVGRLLDEPGLRDQMGENGYQAVKNHFNWDREFKNLFALYRKILKLNNRVFFPK